MNRAFTKAWVLFEIPPLSVSEEELIIVCAYRIIQVMMMRIS